MTTANLPQRPSESPSRMVDEDVIASVAEAIGRLRFGSIALTVHGGKVVQIDVTERQRFG